MPKRANCGCITRSRSPIVRTRSRNALSGGRSAAVRPALEDETMDEATDIFSYLVSFLIDVRRFTYDVDESEEIVRLRWLLANGLGCCRLADFPPATQRL